ncbi:MAG TPA: hypothetical protein VEA37_02155, partial [Flavobacterium sp.]|nr:hypothetical protein [Flavobacterium sp.]
KNPDEAQLKLQADTQKSAQENWEKFVDNELFSKVTNLSVTIDEGTKEAFDYKISESDRKEISGTMKLLTKDSGVLFNQFAEKDGSGNLQINHRKVFEMLVKNKAFDEAVKHAYRDGKAEGAKKEIKDLKNISFKPNESQPTNAAPKTEEEAIALAMRAQGKKL